MKALTIISTRSEAIKMAPVIREFARHGRNVTSRVCVAQQGGETIDQVMSLFDIEPDHELNVMRPDQSLDSVTEAMLEGFAPVIANERPDWILVQGATTAAMAASLAAFYQHVPVAHVEAGLRTLDKHRPFPEEVNRRLVGVLADLHFAPTRWAAENLHDEGVPDDQVVVTGNTVIDAAQYVAQLPFSPHGTPVAALEHDDRRLILGMTQQIQSLDSRLENIFTAFAQIAERHANVNVVVPVYPVPRVDKLANEILGGEPNVTLLPPLDYQSLVWLLKRCTIVISDSGDLQEEAPAFGKPILVLRDTTELPEGIDAGTARLVGTSVEPIVGYADFLLNDSVAYRRIALATNPYGDGHAARRIAARLEGSVGEDELRVQPPQPQPGTPDPLPASSKGDQAADLDDR